MSSQIEHLNPETVTVVGICQELSSFSVRKFVVIVHLLTAAGTKANCYSLNHTGHEH